jgi:hypothetical protein
MTFFCLGLQITVLFLLFCIVSRDLVSTNLNVSMHDMYRLILISHQCFCLDLYAHTGCL